MKRVITILGGPYWDDDGICLTDIWATAAGAPVSPADGRAVTVLYKTGDRVPDTVRGNPMHLSYVVPDDMGAYPRYPGEIYR